MKKALFILLFITSLNLYSQTTNKECILIPLSARDSIVFGLLIEAGNWKLNDSIPDYFYTKKINFGYKNYKWDFKNKNKVASFRATIVSLIDNYTLLKKFLESPTKKVKENDCIKINNNVIFTDDDSWINLVKSRINEIEKQWPTTMTITIHLKEDLINKYLKEINTYREGIHPFFLNYRFDHTHIAYTGCLHCFNSFRKMIIDSITNSNILLKVILSKEINIDKKLIYRKNCDNLDCTKFHLDFIEMSTRDLVIQRFIVLQLLYMKSYGFSKIF
jgi:hypothetical protein